MPSTRPIVGIKGRQRLTPLTRLSRIAAIGPATLTRALPCSRGASERAPTQTPGTLTRQNYHSREIPTIRETCQRCREHLTRRYVTPSAFLSHLVELSGRVTDHIRTVSALLRPLYRLPFPTVQPVGSWGLVPLCPVLLRIRNAGGRPWSDQRNRTGAPPSRAVAGRKTEGGRWHQWNDDQASPLKTFGINQSGIGSYNFHASSSGPATRLAGHY